MNKLPVTWVDTFTDMKRKLVRAAVQLTITVNDIQSYEINMKFLLNNRYERLI